MVTIFDTVLAFCVHYTIKKTNIFISFRVEIERDIQDTYLVIRRRSRKLGEPRRLGIDGDRDERLLKEFAVESIINKNIELYFHLFGEI